MLLAGLTKLSLTTSNKVDDEQLEPLKVKKLAQFCFLPLRRIPKLQQIMSYIKPKFGEQMLRLIPEKIR